MHPLTVRAARPLRSRLPPSLLLFVALSAPCMSPAAAPAPTTVVSAQQAGAVSGQALRSALTAALAAPAPSDVAPEAVRALAFRPDAAVTAREREAFIAHLAKQPGGPGPLEPLVRSGKLMQQFDDLLRRYGYSPQNLGDVLAAHLVISWEIVSGTDSTSQPGGLRAVRRQLAGPLASVEAVAGMSDAAKQAQAERTAYLTMVAASANQALKGGDPARLEELRRSVGGSLRRSGIDLERLVLTPDGLVAR